MLTPVPPLILASASPRRDQLLREMGLRFTIVCPDGVEEVQTGAAPEILAIQNAQRKARAVAGQHPGALVLGADTIVVLDGEALGKPRDLPEAVRMLGRLAGRPHQVMTGLCLIHQHRELAFHDTTRVWMKPLTPAEIKKYFERVNPLDKAGAYAAQELGDTIIERVDGSFSNVMGLPVERLRAALLQFGWPR